MQVNAASLMPGSIASLFRRSAALIVNSGAMALGTIVTAGLGFIYWWLIARSVPAEAFGTASAQCAVMGLIGLVGEAGLGTLLIGEIVRHPGREWGLISSAAVVGVALSTCCAVLFIVGSSLIGGAAGALTKDPAAGVLFVLGSALTGLGMVLDQALVGLLKTPLRLLRQTVFGASKLALIGLSLHSGWTTATTILGTWVAGQFASSLLIVVLATLGGRARPAWPDFRLLLALRARVLDHFLLDVAVQAPTLVLPYVVLVVFSSTTAAPFSALWMVLGVASCVPASLATVLFPTLRTNPARIPQFMTLSLAVSVMFSLSVAILIWFFARELLALFNPAFADAAADLRVFGLSLIGSTLMAHACALARLGDRMRAASGWFALAGIVGVAAAVAGAGSGLDGMVLGWTVAAGVTGAALLALCARMATRSDQSALAAGAG